MSLLGKTFVPLVLGIGLPLLASAAQETTEPIGQALDDLLEQAREDMQLDAAALLVSIGEQALHSAAFGETANNGRAAVELDTAFEAGAMAHAWLSTLVLQQRAKGALSLDQELGQLLPELVGEDCPVHVANLLNHTSGFADFSDFSDAARSRGASYAKLLEPVKSQPLITEPGECMAPSPSNTLLLAALVDSLTKRSAPAALQAAIFDELDMRDSGYELDAAPVEAASDESDEGEPAMVFSALHTSARDLVRFQRSLIDNELLNSEDFDVMTTATRLLDGTSVPDGMGMRRTKVGESIGYLMGKANACVAYFPEHDLSVALVGRGESPRFERLVLNLAERVIEAPAVEIADLYLSEVEMRPFLGTYAIGCNTLLIKPQVGRIVLDRTDEGEHVLLYQGADRFVGRDDPGLELVFDVEGARARSFTLNDHGMRSVAIRFDD